MPTHKNLNLAARQALRDFLLPRSENGKLKHGSVTEAAELFGVSKSTISRIWRTWEARRARSLNGVVDVSSGKKTNGRPLKYVREQLQEELQQIPLRERSTYRSAAHRLDISASTVYRMIRKEKVLKNHSARMKIVLSDENKFERVDFCLSQRGDNGLFKNFNDRIHIDEKWFHLDKKCHKFILAANEKPPHRTSQHNQQHIPKLMFLTAVARPRWDTYNNRMFDGKISIQPMATKAPAVRRSRHRERGTMLWKPLKVTKEVYTNFLLDHVVPAIMQKFPPTEAPIYIQQDNARPHCSNAEFQVKYLEVRELLQEEYSPVDFNWDIRLFQQPPNSPDLNINDLGLYASLQQITWRRVCQTLEQLVENVLEVWDIYPAYKINNLWLTLQCCMNEIIECHGDNDYRIPHMNKQRLERLGQLPVSIPVTPLVDVWEGEPLVNIDEISDDDMEEDENADGNADAGDTNMEDEGNTMEEEGN